MTKWFQDEPKMPEMSERLRAGLKQTGKDDGAFMLDALPELVPGEMHGEAVVYVAQRARWFEEREAWRKRQPYSVEPSHCAMRLFDSDPIAFDTVHWMNWFEWYKLAVDEGESESELRDRAARLVEARRLHERAMDVLWGKR